MLSTEINVCSNSSTYDSSEDTVIGGLSESEYIATTNSHDMGKIMLFFLFNIVFKLITQKIGR